MPGGFGEPPSRWASNGIPRCARGRSEEVSGSGGAGDEGLHAGVLVAVFGGEDVHGDEVFVGVGDLAFGEALVVAGFEGVHHADVADRQDQGLGGFGVEHAGGEPARGMVGWGDGGEQPGGWAEGQQGVGAGGEAGAFVEQVAHGAAGFDGEDIRYYVAAATERNPGYGGFSGSAAKCRNGISRHPAP